ncbi:endo-1,4-beta-xylanase [Bacteroidota bacterium]
MRHIIVVLVIFVSFRAVSQIPEEYLELWDEKEVVERIETGIERNRKARASIKFQSPNDEFIEVEKVSVRQVSHDFLFGANLFMLKGFDTKKQNSDFENAFTHIFNFGTIPFYWSDLEPVQGEPRFSKESVKILRRPAPDIVLDFCLENNLTPKGHPLIWEWYLPDWLPDNPDEQYQLMEKRFTEIAERYSDRIKYWDVTNELTISRPDVIMPEDYALKAYKLSEKLFPSDNKSLINDLTDVWLNYNNEYSHYYQIIQNLRLRGAKIDGIGMQLHLFAPGLYQDVLNGDNLTPLHLFRVLDLYGNFNKPLHISEVSIPTIPDDENGQQIQASVVGNLYRLWFSHNAVQSITWWNFADQTATPNENKWKAGLLDANLDPKPSYNILNRLINNEWTTELDDIPFDGKVYRFKGFFGKYKVEIEKDGKLIVREIHLSKDGPRDFIINLE